MLQEVKQIMSLFEGYPDAYGNYRIIEQGIAGEKNVGRAVTLRKPLNEECWTMHLRGMLGLGVIPINAESKVKFAAIDIDKYDLDHEALIKKIAEHKMPLVVCRSKSGGAHCYIFLREFVSAKVVQGKLREMAGLLGYGTSEVFPKQVEILVDRGDIGQWINMPYFDHANTVRWAYNDRCEKLTLRDFITYAESKRLSEQELMDWGKATKIEDLLPGGPPCLNHIVRNGFPDGTRNNGLFNLGVYAIKSAGEHWEKKLVEYNQKFMNPPLSPEEVIGVIKSLKKKEYNYTCDQHPIQPHCNATKCRACKFGIGNGSGLPVFGTLTKLQTTPPIWFLDIEGGSRMELTTEQLQNQRLFQAACMEHLNIMPMMPKAEVWTTMIQRLMESVSVIEASVDMSPVGQCLEHLDRFCTGKAQAKTADEILLGKPWTNNGRHYFRITDFIQYLDRMRFKHEGLRWICNMLRKQNGRHHFMNIKGKGVNVWSIPEMKIMDGKFSVPDTSEPSPFK